MNSMKIQNERRQMVAFLIESFVIFILGFRFIESF